METARRWLVSAENRLENVIGRVPSEEWYTGLELQVAACVREFRDYETSQAESLEAWKRSIETQLGALVNTIPTEASARERFEAMAGKFPTESSIDVRFAEVVTMIPTYASLNAHITSVVGKFPAETSIADRMDSSTSVSEISATLRSREISLNLASVIGGMMS